jgi:hypothetical protein
VGRRPSTLFACAFAALAAAACGLESNGLEVSLDGSVAPASGPTGNSPPLSADGSIGVPSPDASIPPSGSDATIPADSAPNDDATNADDSRSEIPDVGLPDVNILDPDSSYLDSADPCDLDQDGYRSKEGSCGGNDCCDYDSRANPGDTSFYTSADSCGSYDYDCNGSDDPEYAKVNCTIGVLVCNGSGFDDDPPACGVKAQFDACNLGVGCYTTKGNAAQACR